MKNLIFTVLLLVLLNSDSYADGSVYNRFGIGELILPQNSLSSGRGGNDNSILSNYSTNRVNPAGLGKIKTTTFSADLYYTGFYMRDYSTNNFLSSIKFYGFDLSIPIDSTYGVTVNAGLIPYSIVAYSIKNDMIINNLLNELEYYGDGGLSSANLGSSLRIFSDLYSGIRLNYLFGNIYHQIKQSTGAVRNETFRSTKLYGFNLTFGLIYTGLGNALGLNSSHNLNIGLVLSNSSSLSAEVYRYYDFYYNNKLITQDSILLEEGKFKLPLLFGFGASYIFNQRYMISSDYYFQDWSNTSLLKDMYGNLKKSQRIAVGFDILPLSGKVTSFQKIGFRLGIYFNQTYLNVNNFDLNEFGFTGGTDFQIFGDTRLAIGFEYKQRGDTKYLKENIYLFKIGLIGSELWFVRPKEE